jgi:hypothetical protein
MDEEPVPEEVVAPVVSGEQVKLSDVLVTIEHPFGQIEMPLKKWMKQGPGLRPLVRPIAARSRRTGESLPLEVIPLAYRNDETSRRLIAEGQLESPW